MHPITVGFRFALDTVSSYSPGYPGTPDQLSLSAGTDGQALSPPVQKTTLLFFIQLPLPLLFLPFLLQGWDASPQVVRTFVWSRCAGK